MNIPSSSIAVALLALAAAGCGSSGNDAASSASPATASETMAPAADAFTGDVANIVRTSSDTAKPVAVDASSTGGSETAEPAPSSDRT